jgi:hypothetical protein
MKLFRALLLLAGLAALAAVPALTNTRLVMRAKRR